MLNILKYNSIYFWFLFKGENPYSGDENYKRIHNFLERIPLDLLALASYNCGAYTRALLHYEHFIRSEKQGMQGQHHFDFLQVSKLISIILMLLSYVVSIMLG